MTFKKRDLEKLTDEVNELSAWNEDLSSKLRQEEQNTKFIQELKNSVFSEFS